MNSEPGKAIAMVAASVLFGGVAFFFFGKSSRQIVLPVAITATRTPTPPDQSPVSRFSIQFDTDLEAAVAAAKEARAAGTFKALATTPDEFARTLGKLNFRLHDFGERHEIPPEPGDTAYAPYSEELKQITADLANLLSDETLLSQVEDNDPNALAHHQALMAGGALGLDDAATAKIEALIAAANAKALPEGIGDRELTAEEEAEFDRKFDALTTELEAQIRPLLNAEQTKRLDQLGPDQVLFGLSEK